MDTTVRGYRMCNVSHGSAYGLSFPAGVSSLDCELFSC